MALPTASHLPALPIPFAPTAVMQGLEQLVTAPLEPWDALVCTSRSALNVVKEAMALHA